MVGDRDSSFSSDFGPDPLRQPLLPATTTSSNDNMMMTDDEELQQEVTPTKGVYSKVALEESNDEGGSHGIEEDMMEDEVVSLGDGDENTEGSLVSRSASWAAVERALHKTLFPDRPCLIRDIQVMEGQFSVKLLKFLAFTLAGISFLHWIVSHRPSHRDTRLTFGQLWMYEGNLIASDTIVFFVVGRLWRQRGVDHLAWLGVVVLSNLYFESQHYTSFLRHSFTLYEMHCGMSIRRLKELFIEIPQSMF